MDDNTFWIRFVMTLACLIAVGIGTVGGCTAYETKRIADAVEKGADPIDARCGIAGTSNSGGTICTVRASQKVTQ